MHHKEKEVHPKEGDVLRWVDVMKEKGNENGKEKEEEKVADGSGIEVEQENAPLQETFAFQEDALKPNLLIEE